MDVLVSMFLCSIALIGIDAMLIQTSKDTESLYFLRVGMQQILQLHEQLLVRSDAHDLLIQWNQQNQRVLPNGQGELIYHQHKATLKVSWKQRKLQECDNHHLDIHCLMLEISSR